jgi:hypothetical protein
MWVLFSLLDREHEVVAPRRVLLPPRPAVALKPAWEIDPFIYSQRTDYWIHSNAGMK